MFVLPAKKKRISLFNSRPKSIFFFVITLAILQLIDCLVVKYSSFFLNPKLFFGLFLNNFWSLALSFVFLILAGFLAIKFKNLSLVIVFFFSGLVSNLLDRIFYGGVVDYLNFFNWFYFNFADVLIVIVLFFVGYKIIFPKEKLTTNQIK